jgi:dTDP-4-amino-4,6-dideoxygalactose transaminase
VANSTQLAIYCEAENCNRAAYAVMEKKMRVKEPRARTQLIKDTISDEHKQKVFEAVGQADFDLATTDWLTKRVISLPMHTELEEEQLNYITTEVLNYINQ